MKTIKLSVMALAVTLSTAACNNAGSGTEDATTSGTKESGQEDHDHDRRERTSADEGMTETLMDGETATAVTEDYLSLKQALVQSDARAANDAAQKIVKRLEGTDDELGSKLVENAQNLTDADGLDDQRKHFEKVSENMYELTSQIAIGKDLYWQHCPMAMDNEGANWISDSKEIRNPYFGDKMLKCGRVEEEI